MADQEEDFSSLPLPDRFAHKNWKVRKEGYEAAAKEFNLAQSESDTVVREFIQDPGLWKAAVGDSNVAAQQEALVALCSFLQIAGQQGCTRTRHHTIVPIVEKGLAATRPAAKQSALEALLLYIELDKPEPVIEELLPILSHKQPKIIAATLSALTSIYHAFGCKTVEPKPVLKFLPKVFGHADKNVRTEAQNLTVEFYRWLKDAMKPLFWNELKPVQQQDLEKLFEKVKDEPAPKQERLLRSQQAAPPPAAPAAGNEVGAEDAVNEEEEIDLEPELVVVDVMPKVPKDFQERLASSKWKDRKEALDDLYTAINHPAIQDGPFDEFVRGFAKCMKDANIAVVTVTANCVEVLAKGLRKSFAKYRSMIMSPMLERLKEKKQSVTDAIGQALDAVFLSTSLSDCLEEILEFLKHKNPQVKLESTRFLIRSLKTTKEAPAGPEVKLIADAATKLLTESQETQRSAGAEVLGVLWKIMGDRMMAPHLEGLDEIRKTKIKEYYESAEVKAKFKPKAAPAPPKPAAAPTQKKPLAKKATNAPVKKSAPPPAAPSPVEEPASATPLKSRPTSRPGATKVGASKPSLAAPAGGLKLQKRPLGASSAASPKRPIQLPAEEPSVPASNLGLGGRGLAGRPLGKPLPAPVETVAPESPSGLSGVERAELEELRAEVERLRRQTEDMRSERMRLYSQLSELQNQNAQLIEDHTRDILSIKAKETQLTRARGDAEAAEQSLQTQHREVERLKRELSRQIRANSPPPIDVSDNIYQDIGMNGSTRYEPPYKSYRYRNDVISPGEGKENLSLEAVVESKLSPHRGSGPTHPPFANHNNISVPHSALGGRVTPSSTAAESQDGDAYPSRSQMGTNANSSVNREGMESWKRAAEVTQNLKARIEQMKARQGLASRPR